MRERSVLKSNFNSLFIRSLNGKKAFVRSLPIRSLNGKTAFSQARLFEGFSAFSCCCSHVLLRIESERWQNASRKYLFVCRKARIYVQSYHFPSPILSVLFIGLVLFQEWANFHFAIWYIFKNTDRNAEVEV